MAKLRALTNCLYVTTEAALLEVQLRMLTRKNHEYPYYWASFIQSGEWANPDGKR